MGVVGDRISTWTDGLGVTHAQIMAVIRNDGPSWVEIATPETSYEVLDPQSVTALRGQFSWSFPQRLAPGSVGYLVDTLSVAVPPANRLVDVRATVRHTLSDPATPVLEVSQLRLVEGSAGPEVSGRVRNISDRRVRIAVVGAMILDRRDVPLGALYDLVTVNNLAPGTTRTFRTAYPGIGPIPAGAVGRLLPVAVELP